MPASKKPNEICLTRVYDAPVQVVWDAFTDPEQVKHWWGPRGFTLTTHGKDLRPGGFWTYTMHGPDGVDYPNHAVYHEVEPCRKLVYDHGGYEDRPPLFRVTVLFSETDGKTRMDMTMALPTAEEAEATRKMIKEVGGNATWDRLAEYLEETRHGQTSFVINRSFPAPPERLYDMWTQPEHLVQWQPPVGFAMDMVRADIRPGGNCLFRMHNDADVSFLARFDYRELRKPTRIAYVQLFCDEAERPISHPGMPDFPQKLLTTIDFTPEDAETTRVTVTSTPLGTTTPAEDDAFTAERSGMTQGWTGSFDKLDACLAD